MDAREFEPDDPLPQTCQHCKWALVVNDAGLSVMTCRNSEAITRPSSRPPFDAKIVSPGHTCKHWEERE